LKPFAVIALMAAATLTMLTAGSVSAQDGSEIKSGIVVGVEADAGGALSRFAVADQAGQVTEYTVEGSTEYGLENQAGDRWVSTQSSDPSGAVSRLRDHQSRFAAITVTSVNGVATSVVERESGKLETSLGFLFAVFAVTWAGFFAYIFFVSRKQRELRKELARLKASIGNG
jgi:CcmD family protein